MATEVDKRVVEMQFDNKDFEKNCQASLTTLEKLKMALNFDGAKGLESMGKAASKIDLSNVAKGAEAVQVKFSAMNIAGMTMISELTKGFINLGKQIWNISFGQAAKGGMARTLKIDQAKFQMKALAANLDEVKKGALSVQEVMDGMLDSVDRAVTGTAYGYDAAAAVASQLMASGLTDYDKMYDHLRAIAGAAAMTGRSFEDIGNIFTTVASNGKLMTMQLRQFSASGLNLSATLAQNLGKTEEQINDMVQHGKISFEQFSEALSEAFGEAAGKADETWSGVTSNVKAQISRIGQLFTDPFVKHMIPVLASLKADIKKFRDVLVPVGKTFDLIFGHVAENMKKALDTMDFTRMEYIVNGLENIALTIIMIGDTIRKAFLDLFPKQTLDEIIDAAKEFELFTQKLVPTRETLDGLRNVFKAILSPVRLAYNILKAFASSVVKPLSLSILQLLGAFLRLGNALRPLVTAMVETLTKSKFLDDVFLLIAGTIIVVVNAVKELVDALAEISNEIFSSTTFSSIISALQTIGDCLSKVILEALKLIFNLVYYIFAFIKAGTIVQIFHNIGQILSVVISLVLLGIQTIMNVIKGISESATVLGSIFRLIKEIALLVKDVVTGQDVSERLKNIKDLLGGVGDAVVNAINIIKEKLGDLNAGKLIVMGFGIALIFLVWSLHRFVDAATGVAKGMTSFFGIFTQIKNILRNFATANPIIQILLGLTVVIGMLTASLQTLALIPANDLLRVSVTLGILVGGIIAIGVAMAMLQKYVGAGFEKTMANIALTLIALSASVMILAESVKRLTEYADMDWKAALNPLGMVLGLLLGLSVVIVGLSRLMGDKNAFLKQSAFLLAMAVAIRILINSVLILAAIPIENVKQLLVGVGVIIAMIVGLGASVALAGATGAGVSAVLALMGFVITLKMLLKLLYSLSEMDYDKLMNGLWKLTTSVIAPILGFIALAVVAVRASKNKELFGELAKMFLSITSAVLVLVASVVILGQFKGETLIKGWLAVVGVIVALTTGFAIIMKGVSTLKGHDYKLVIGALKQYESLFKVMSIAILAFAAAAVIVSKVPEEATASVTWIFMLMAGVLAGLTFVSKYAKDVSAKPIIALATTLALLMGALAVLSLNTDTKAVVAAGVAIMCVMIGLGAILAFLDSKEAKKMDEVMKKDRSKDMLAKAAFITSLTAAMGLIIVALDKFANTKIADLGSFMNLTIWTSVVFGLLGVIALAIINVMDDNIDKDKINGATVLILSLVASMGVILGAMVTFANISISNPETFMSLVIWMTAIFGLLGALAIAIISVSNGVETDKIKQATILILALTGSLVVIAVAVASIAKTNFGNPIAANVAIVLMGGLIATIGGLAIVIMSVANSVSSTEKILAGAGVIVALAGSVVIIALALKALINATSDNYFSANNLGLLASLASLVIILGMMSVLAGVIMAVNFKSSKVLAGAGAFAILAASVSMIALSLGSILKIDINDSNLASIAWLAVIIGAVSAVFLALMAFGDTIKPAEILIAAAAFAAIGGSISMIILVLSEFVKIAQVATPEAMEEVRDTLNAAMLGFAALVIIGTILGSLLGMGYGAPIIVGIFALTAAFIAFAGGVAGIAAAAYLFAEALQIIVDAIKEFNGLEIDGNKLEKNFRKTIEACVAVIPELINGLKTFIAEGLKALASLASTVRLIAITYVTEFLKGVEEKLPDILETVLNIMKTIGTYLTSEENLQIIEDFATAAGKVIYRVIKGVIMSLVDIVNDWLDEVQDKYWETKEGKEIKKQNKELTYDNYKDLVVGLSGEDAYTGPIKKYLDAYLNTTRGKNKGFEGGFAEDIKYGNKQIMKYEELNREGQAAWAGIRDQLKDNYDKQNEVYNLLMGEMNKEIALADKTGYDVESIHAMYEELAGFVGLNDTYVKNFRYNSESVVDTLEEGEQQLENLESQGAKTYDTLEKGADEAAGAIAETGDQAVKTGETISNVFSGDIFQSFIDGASNLIGGNGEGGLMGAIKDAADKGLPAFKNMFGELGTIAGEKFGFNFDINAFNEADIIATMKGVADGTIGMGEIIGELTGQAQARAEYQSYEEEIAALREEGMKKVITNQKAYDASSGKSGFSYAWQVATDDNGKAYNYRSVEEYAAAQYKLKHELDASGEVAMDYFHIMDKITEATKDASKSTGGLGDAMGGLDKKLVSSAKKFGDFFNNLKDSMSSALANVYDEVKESDPIGTEEMLKRMEKNTHKVAIWARQIQELAAKGMSEGLLNELKDMGPQAADKVDAFARMTSEQLERANQLFAAKTKLPEYATENIVQSYKDAGFMSSLGFAEGVDPVAAENAFRQLGMDGLSALEKELQIESPSKKTMKDGLYATMGLANGLVSSAGMLMLKSSANKVADAVLTTLKTKLSPNYGRKLINDFINGMVNAFTTSPALRMLTNNASNLANSIMNKFRTVWDEHSPSEKARELGEYFLRGLGLGFEDGTTYLERQTGDTADDILQLMKDNLYGSLSNISEDGVYQPVIRPVFDLTSLDEGWNYINSWFADGRTISLDGNIQRLTPTTKENNDILDREILDAVRSLDVDGVRNELNGIRSDISELQTAVTNLQVVMDTGALVGQLVNPMDNALGNKALFNGRGRY